MSAAARRRRLFASVFPVPDLTHTTPTPVATPLVGSTEPGQAFGATSEADASAAYPIVQRTIAWSTATRFLALPDHSPSVCQEHTCRTDVWHPDKRRTAEVEEAITLLISQDCLTKSDESNESLVQWYTTTVRKHFENYVIPDIQERKDAQTLLEITNALCIAHEAYLNPLERHVLSLINDGHSHEGQSVYGDTPDAQKLSKKFRNKLVDMFHRVLSNINFFDTLSDLLYDTACSATNQPGEQRLQSPNTHGLDKVVASILDGLRTLGLQSDETQIALCRALDRFLTKYLESRQMKVDWMTGVSRIEELKLWIENQLGRFNQWALSLLHSDMSTSSATPSAVSEQTLHTRYWQDIAVARLGRARLQHLFNYIVRWDASLGAVYDIKEWISTPEARMELVMAFKSQLYHRLLHPAITTTDILNLYISIISAFHELEPKGVLLHRVARPIRDYLGQREDTVQIIVESCVADIEENERPVSSGIAICPSITKAMNDMSAGQAPDDHELNWGDLDWTPEPYDADPGYRKVDDIMTHVLTLFDRDDFMKELQSILADSLLRQGDDEHEKEIRLLELFKKYFGSDKLQACEVMLKDIQDSKRYAATIKGRDEKPSAEESHQIQLHTKIISKFFWPSLREDHFRIPTEVTEVQEAYAKGFESIKDSRQLRWFNAQGRVTVRLELEDRTDTHENVQPYQASVIYAFQDPDGGEGEAPRTAKQLETALEMDEGLVKTALAFWVGKLVLKEDPPGTFSVLERLDEGAADQEATAAAAAAVAADADANAGAVKSQDELFGEKAEQYRQFVTMMLTNQGSKPTAIIYMMMKMMLPEGFPFSEDDLRRFLNDLAEERSLMKIGPDVFGIPKL
ncbi:MAG: hypothetical protein M1820_007651 [Bogoriella megaspora]|nr:MAG: hypothetical protein M1820_007651 [Bogoriella megaspora]